MTVFKDKPLSQVDHGATCDLQKIQCDAAKIFRERVS